MIKDIRCPKCDKLIGKSEESSNTEGIYLWCPRCKVNIDIKNNKVVNIK